MIQHEALYLNFIQQQGVGKNDVVASSPKSYCSYLNSVSRLLGSDVSPKVLSCEADVTAIVARLRGKRADTTIDNYRSAMRQYVKMVQQHGLAK